MRHALASVTLLVLVVGCDSPSDGPAETPYDPTITANKNTNTALTNTLGASSVTGPSGSTGSNVAGTTTGSSVTNGSVTNGSVSGGTVTSGSGGSVTSGSGSGGESGSDGEHGIAGEAGAPNYPEDPYPALVMTLAQREALPDGQGLLTAVSTDGSVQEDPDDLWVTIADTSMVCSELPPLPACGGHWQVGFGLPRSMQQEGTYELEVFSSAVANEPEDPNLPDTCGAAGLGGPADGQIVEVLAIDASEIRFRLHADSPLIDDEINGIYTVPLCH